eukprot:1073422-Pelagomonas_calceolata.AAC.1
MFAQVAMTRTPLVIPYRYTDRSCCLNGSQGHLQPGKFKESDTDSMPSCLSYRGCVYSEDVCLRSRRGSPSSSSSPSTLSSSSSCITDHVYAEG